MNYFFFGKKSKISRREEKKWKCRERGEERQQQQQQIRFHRSRLSYCCCFFHFCMARRATVSPTCSLGILWILFREFVFYICRKYFMRFFTEETAQNSPI